LNVARERTPDILGLTGKFVHPAEKSIKLQIDM